MTEPNPDVSSLPLPDGIAEGSAPDPVRSTAPKAESTQDEAALENDELDESAEEAEPPVAFPITGPGTGSVVPPGIVNPQ